MSRHRHESALGVAGDEQLAVVGDRRRCRGRERAPRCLQCVDHVFRLLIRIQERVISQRGRIVAGVVRRYDDVSLRSELQCYSDAFSVGRREARDVERAVGVGAVCVQKEGAGTLTRGVAATGKHECARCGSRFSRCANGLVFELVDDHGALRGGEQFHHLLAHVVLRGDVQKILWRECAHLRGGIFQQIAALWRRTGGRCWSWRGGRSRRGRHADRGVRTHVVAAATGEAKSGQQGGRAGQSTHRQLQMKLPAHEQAGIGSTLRSAESSVAALVTMSN